MEVPFDSFAPIENQQPPEISADDPGVFAAGDAAPRTDTEKLVARVWAKALQRGKIGVNDNFFALGGHSLSAMRVLARLYSTLGVELPVRSIFESPTVAALAARIDSLKLGIPPGGELSRPT